MLWGGTLTGIADQVVSSATLLTLHLILARLLTPAGFGAFALMVSAAMVGLAVVAALILDPLSVRRRGGAGYRGATVLLLGLLSVPMAVLALVLVLAGGNGPGPALAVGVLGTPGLGLLWLARRMAYLDRRSSAALLVSVVWAVGAFGSVLVLVAVDALTAVSAAAAISVSAGASGFLGLGASIRWPSRRLWRSAVDHHWRFGGWLLAGLPFWALAMHAPLWLLAGLRGEEAAGAFRAIHLLGMPLVQLAAAVGAVHQPRIATRVLIGDGDGARFQAWSIGFLVVLPAIPWGLVLTVWPELVTWFFGPSYSAVAGLAPVMIAAAAVKALTTGPNLALRGARRARAVFAGTLASGVVALIASVSLIPVHGTAGAVLAFGLGAAANLLMLSVSCGWRRPRSVAAEC